VEEIRTAMNNEGLQAAGKLLKEEWIRPFVVMGSHQECADQIRSIHEKCGIDIFNLPLMDLESAAESMADMAKIIRML
jgi:alkanesulfonate monooxygenase SsuD/methylene tetrahydromethanopterin reductase-like flavin-dependent oxidoreductase (luciferase family)